MQIFRVENGQAKVNGENNVIDNIKSFEANMNDYLYDVEPQSQNLFFVGNFSEIGEGSNAIKQFYNAQYRIRSVKIPDMNFVVDNNNITHVPVFKEVGYDYGVQIDWFEDVYHSVRKYHDDWMRRWYDRVYDVLRCGTSGKFRKLELYAYHYVKSEGEVFDDPKPELLFVITISGMVPMSLPGMRFDYNADGNDELFSVQYKCARVDIRYNKDFTSKNDNLYGSTAQANGSKSIGSVWQSKGLSSELSGSGDELTNEALRITRASTTRYDSMPLS